MLTLANSSLLGLLTIRSSKAEKMLCKEFDNFQDTHTAMYFLVYSCTSAFALWIDLVSVGFVTFATYSFIVIDDQNVTGGQVGLALTQVLTICLIMMYNMKMVAEILSQMVSIERVFQFTKLDQEGSFESEPGTGPNKNWPNEGEIKFEKFNLKYSDTSEPVLKNLEFSIEPGMKVKRNQSE